MRPPRRVDAGWVENCERSGNMLKNTITRVEQSHINEPKLHVAQVSVNGCQKAHVRPLNAVQQSADLWPEGFFNKFFAFPG